MEGKGLSEHAWFWAAFGVAMATVGGLLAVANVAGGPFGAGITWIAIGWAAVGVGAFFSLWLAPMLFLAQRYASSLAGRVADTALSTVRGKLLLNSAELKVTMASLDASVAALTPKIHFRNHAREPIRFRIDSLAMELGNARLVVQNPTPRDVLVPPGEARFMDCHSSAPIRAGTEHRVVVAYSLSYGPDGRYTETMAGRVLVEARAFLNRPGEWSYDYRELGPGDLVMDVLSVIQQPSVPRTEEAPPQ